jgi:hypothetical protein
MQIIVLEMGTLGTNEHCFIEEHNEAKAKYLVSSTHQTR